MKLFRLLLILACATVPTTTWAAKATCLKRQLALFALAQDVDRKGEAVTTWFEYKNGPNPSPKTVDLADPCLINTCAPLNKIPSPTEIDRETLLDGGNRSLYDQTVILLRKGDTVKFGERAFVLGEFLGAGNTTHVYKIKDSDTVIRIPFLPDFLHVPPYSAPPSQRQQNRMLRTLDYSRHYRVALEGRNGAVEILEADPQGRFNLTQFIDGKTTGEDWILQKSGITKVGSVFWMGDGFLRKENKLSPKEKKITQKLAELMEDNGDATFEMEDGKTRYLLRPSKARQYLLDQDGNWTLVDHDSPDKRR